MFFEYVFSLMGETNKALNTISSKTKPTMALNYLEAVIRCELCLQISSVLMITSRLVSAGSWPLRMFSK